MRHRVLAHLNADIAPAHLVGHCGGGAGAEEGVEDKVAGVGGDVENTLDEAFGFGGVENSRKVETDNLPFRFLIMTNIRAKP